MLQPRVTPSLPIGSARVAVPARFSGPNGLDPYALAVSDVYQDLFEEGSFCGKGIYEVDSFEAALEGQIPENSVLSHDLLEGIFARAGLAPTSRSSRNFPRATPSRRRASIAGCAATGSCCPGSSAFAARPATARGKPRSR
jgi:cyclic beta-1,2-glucan synthetase